MATAKIISLLIVLSVLMSGCLSSEDKEEKREADREAGGSSGGSQRQREVKTPLGMQREIWTSEETDTEGEKWTPEKTELQGETIPQEELETPVEAETQVELNTPKEIRISDEPEMKQTEAWTREVERTGTVPSNGTASTSHLVRLKNYLMTPSSLEINVGDTVIWRNYQESSVLALTSREHLFEDQRLAYGNTMEYMFNKPGSYNFSVKGYPKMQTTITVK